VIILVIRKDPISKCPPVNQWESIRDVVEAGLQPLEGLSLGVQVVTRLDGDVDLVIDQVTGAVQVAALL